MLATLLAFWFGACAEDLEPPTDPEPPMEDLAKMKHVEEAGVTTSTVDAVDSVAWVYFDLDAKREIVDAAADTSWDIAFQRYLIKCNGGSSGSGNVGAALVVDTFANVQKAPNEDIYVLDAPDGDDQGTDPDLAFLQGDKWFAYDVSTHVLTPRDQTYVVRTTSGAYFKIGLVGYYDDAGTAGYLKLKWTAVTQ